MDSSNENREFNMGGQRNGNNKEGEIWQTARTGEMFLQTDIVLF